jgi:hypothetical protein
MNAYLNPHAIEEGATEAERARFAISSTSYLEELDHAKNPHTLEETTTNAEKTKLVPELTVHPESLACMLSCPARNPYATDQAMVEAERVKFKVGVASHPERLLPKLSNPGRNSYASGQASVEGASARFMAAGAPFSPKYHSTPSRSLTCPDSSAFELDRERECLEEQNRQGTLHKPEELAQREREVNVRQGRDRQPREQHEPVPSIITHCTLGKGLQNGTLYAQATPPTPVLQLPPLNPLVQVHNNFPHYNGWHQLQPEQYYPKTDPQAYSLSSGPAAFQSFQMLQYHTSALPMTTAQSNLNAHNVDTLASTAIANADAYQTFSYQSPGILSTNHTTLHEFAAGHPPASGPSKSHTNSNSGQQITCPSAVLSMIQVHENHPTTAVPMSVRMPLARGKFSMSSHHPADRQHFSTKSQDRMKSTTQPVARQSLSPAIPLNPPSDPSNALPAGKKRDLCQYAEDGMKEVVQKAEDLTFKKAKTT